VVHSGHARARRGTQEHMVALTTIKEATEGSLFVTVTVVIEGGGLSKFWDGFIVPCLRLCFV
jgi:hypothetical protein